MGSVRLENLFETCGGNNNLVGPPETGPLSMRGDSVKKERKLTDEKNETHERADHSNPA